jgi:hypothetical protein
MKLLQKPIVIDRSTSLLSVNPETFAEIKLLLNDSYLFEIGFKINLTSTRKNLDDYDRVVVTIKQKEQAAVIASSVHSNTVSEVVGKKENSISQKTVSVANVVKSLKPNNGILAPKLPPKVVNKLYSGLQVLNDMNQKEQFLEQINIPITAQVQDAKNNLYTMDELVAPAYKPLRMLARLQNNKLRSGTSEYEASVDSHDTSHVDPTDVLERINLELCDITTPVTDPHVSTLNSESHIDDPKLRIAKTVARGRSPLNYDIVKYYLNDVPKSPQEDAMRWYDVRSTTGHLKDVEIRREVFIKKSNKNMNLSVRFDLYKKNSNVVDETLTLDLPVHSHVEAFESLSDPPEVKIHAFPHLLGLKVLPRSHNLTIVDKEKTGSVVGYNIYIKDITLVGDVSSYRKIGYVRNTGTSHFSFSTKTDLSVVRVVPVDKKNKETNLFTNVVVGPGHKVIGALTILPSHFGNNKIRVDVFNVPKDTVNVTLYRRDCTSNPDDPFVAISTMKGRAGNTTSTFFDSHVHLSRTYEYYVVALGLSKSTKEEIPNISNYVMFKNTPSRPAGQAVTVDLSDTNASSNPNGYMSVSFRLTTTVSSTENQRITETLRTQLGELYDQYLNPATNSSSPLAADQNGVPTYGDLFFHEIVRTNLNTGERETFELVPDGVFEDKPETQRNFNIKPVNPLHAYRYHVFTHKKNPIELFKKFVARGIDKKGKEWFYLPYKWRNASAKLGKLYPDDKEGIPVIDAYESFTSESFGLTASHHVDGAAQYTSLTQIDAKRIDRNTVKISWKFQGISDMNKLNLYDSFVVMKVVNGIRSFVGRTHNNFVYHNLSAEDLGTVYYIVVPIMAEFDIDEPGYSNSILVEPEGLTPRVKAVALNSGLQKSVFSAVNDEQASKSVTESMEHDFIDHNLKTR